MAATPPNTDRAGATVEESPAPAAIAASPEAAPVASAPATPTAGGDALSPGGESKAASEHTPEVSPGPSTTSEQPKKKKKPNRAITQLQEELRSLREQLKEKDTNQFVLIPEQNVLTTLSITKTDITPVVLELLQKSQAGKELIAELGKMKTSVKLSFLTNELLPIAEEFRTAQTAFENSVNAFQRGLRGTSPTLELQETRDANAAALRLVEKDVNKQLKNLRLYNKSSNLAVPSSSSRLSGALVGLVGGAILWPLAVITRPIYLFLRNTNRKLEAWKESTNFMQSWKGSALRFLVSGGLIGGAIAAGILFSTVVIAAATIAWPALVVMGGIGSLYAAYQGAKNGLNVKAFRDALFKHPLNPIWKPLKKLVSTIKEELSQTAEQEKVADLMAKHDRKAAAENMLRQKGYSESPKSSSSATGITFTWGAHSKSAAGTPETIATDQEEKVASEKASPPRPGGSPSH